MTAIVAAAFLFMGVKMKFCSSTARMKRVLPVRHRLHAGLLAALTALVWADQAYAQHSVELAPQTYSISSGSLGDALNQLASQSNLQIVYSPDLVKGKIAKSVTGQHTWRQALERLLAGSGLEWGFVNETTVVIRKQKKTTSIPTNQAVKPQAQSDESEIVNIPEILVVGSRSLNTSIARTRDDAQPYVVFNREEIEKAPVTNIEEFLRDHLTSASTPQTAAQAEGGFNRSTINLRGLGDQQTLILVDGHRMAGANMGDSSGQPDLNGIPLSAVERIEVLPATASGIYGGGATGGAINIILRHDYAGIEAKVTYGDSFNGGGSTRRVDFTGGFSLEDGRTSVLVAGSYADSSDLYVRDRDFLRRGRARILANNPSALDTGAAPLGATTNISTPRVFDLATYLATQRIEYLPGPNLVLDDGTPLNSYFTSIPYGYEGVGSDNGAALVSNAGRYNLEDAPTAQATGGGRQSLLNAPKVEHLTITARREFTDWLDAYLDLSASKNQGAFTSTRVNSSFLVAADAPSNPFQQDVWITTPASGTDQVSTSTDRDARAVAGILVKLPKDWKLIADYTWNRTRTDTTYVANTLSPDASVAVANGVDSSGQPFDPLRDTNLFPLNFAPYLAQPAKSPEVRSTLTGASARVSGPIGWKLPGGQPTLTFAYEHRKAAIGDYSIVDPAYTQTFYSRSQTVDSLYLESLIPIYSQANRIPGIDLLELQLAVRRDAYLSEGANSSFSYPGVDPVPVARVERKLNSVDPTIGLKYQPISDVTLRGSYGTGFLPPALGLLVSGPTYVGDGITFGLTDPQRGNEPLGEFTYATGGNPDLRPEKSTSVSAGIILTPRFIPELRVSIDWTKISKRDNVAQFAPEQANINNEDLIPGFITRGPASDGFNVGPIIAFGPPAVNVARQTVKALDLALDYRLETSRGAVTFSAAGTRLYGNEQQVLSTLPVIDLAGSFAGLTWQANASVGWDSGPWSARWTARYYDSYCLNPGCRADANTLSQGSLSVPSQTYQDLYVGYSFGSDPSIAALANVDIQLSARNVFNKEPPVDIARTNYYSTYGDPRLATYFLAIKKAFK